MTLGSRPSHIWLGIVLLAAIGWIVVYHAGAWVWEVIRAGLGMMGMAW